MLIIVTMCLGVRQRQNLGIIYQQHYNAKFALVQKLQRVLHCGQWVALQSARRIRRSDALSSTVYNVAAWARSRKGADALQFQIPKLELQHS